MKWLMRYLKYYVYDGHIYKGDQKEVELVRFMDFDAGDRDRRMSTSSYVFILCGNCISWKFHLQPIIAFSTIEAKYIAATEFAKEYMWLKGLLIELCVFEHELILFSYGQSAIDLCKKISFS